MKPMSERKMDMRAGKPDSDGYFPSEAEHRILGRCGEIRDPKYPDTEEAILRDENSFVKDVNADMPKSQFRH
jgi:hypothetical protein